MMAKRRLDSCPSLRAAVRALCGQLRILALTLCCVYSLSASVALAAPEATAPSPKALAAQESRAEAIARASASTVAVFEASGAGGGSAVIISADGYALTNFHVVMPCGPSMQCGLADGRLYDAVLVGVDPVGDVALIQLLGRDDFTPAEIADSDEVRTGDWCFAAGNPFLLADDFRPTITYGIVSGVHRYQYPSQTLLEYTDCIQTDAAINPGNSGGPLFDAQGRLIGVNGRGSFEKRGRVNVGVGYAISINQIMRFLGHLKSGRIVDHASLGATVSTQEGTAVIDDILESSDIFRRGLRYSDVVVQFDGRDIASANALKNMVGVYPPGWRVPLVYRRGSEIKETEIRLMNLHGDAELVDLVQNAESEPDPKQPRPGAPLPGGDAPSEDAPGEGEPKPQPGKAPHPPGPSGARGQDPEKLPAAVAERFERRRGYANYWYNARMQRQLWEPYVERSGLSKAGSHWKIRATLAEGGEMRLATGERQADILLPQGASGIVFDAPLAEQLSPPRSGGLLPAIRMWQQLLAKGMRQFGEVYYVGQLTAGPGRLPCECLIGIAEGMEIRFLFDLQNGDLAAIELFPSDDLDPCEIWFSDFEERDGRRLPMRWLVRHGDDAFADLRIDSWEFDAPSSADAKKLGETN